MRLVTSTVLVVALATAALIGLAPPPPPPASAAGSGTITVQLAAPDGTAIRLAGVEQTAQFQIPSGQYVVQLRTPATTGTPAQVLWLGRPGGGYRYVTDRSAAVPVRVVFGGHGFWGGPVPQPVSP